MLVAWVALAWGLGSHPFACRFLNPFPNRASAVAGKATPLLGLGSAATLIFALFLTRSCHIPLQLQEGQPPLLRLGSVATLFFLSD